MSIEEIIEWLERQVQKYEVCASCDALSPLAPKYRDSARLMRAAIEKLRTHPDAQPNEPQGDGWISVEDRLPETGVPVLIHNPHWDYGVVANYAGEGVWMNTWYQRMTFTPTHWRPLPDPPKEA